MQMILRLNYLPVSAFLGTNALDYFTEFFDFSVKGRSSDFQFIGNIGDTCKFLCLEIFHPNIKDTL